MDKTKLPLFSNVTDPRIEKKCKHRLDAILFIAFATLISNGDDFEDMEIFGNQHYDWLNDLLNLPNGIPSHDTFNRVLQMIDPSTLSEYEEELLSVLKEKQICLDGKKIRGASPKSRGNKGLYILSAWVSELNLCIGQSKVDDKSNEITAIPELIKLLDLKNSIVTIDAIGCQKSIAELIIKNKGDYLLALKKNQKDTFQIVEDCFQFLKPHEIYEQDEEKNHGRIEHRKCSILHTEQLKDEDKPKGWDSLFTLLMIESTRIIEGKKQHEIRYYISSKTTTSESFNNLIRNHWSIENQLHWHLDVTFNEDRSRARTENAPMNLNILRKWALQHISNTKIDKLSKKKRRFKASIDINYLKKLLEI